MASVDIVPFRQILSRFVEQGGGDPMKLSAEIQQLSQFLQKVAEIETSTTGTGRSIADVTRDPVTGDVIVDFSDGTMDRFPLRDGAPGGPGPKGDAGSLDDYWPWVHGIPYDDRNAVEIPQGSHGVWLTT